MQRHARVLRQPGLDLGVLVRGVVVADDVQFGTRVGGGGLFQEAQELLVPVLRVAGVGDLAGGGVERGEQAGDAVPGLVVGLPPGDPGPHRQDRLGPLEGLVIRGLRSWMSCFRRWIACVRVR